ncbi:MAG: class IV adenylate cyclase [Pseudonocardiaceae bacterium]
MLVEAELKAVVRDLDAVRAALNRRGPAQGCTYADRYFDYPDRRLTEQGRELRVRTITDDTGQNRVLLTYKEAPVDAASGAKPEHETTAKDADVLATVLTALGVEEFIVFHKHCVNYRFTALGHELLASLVTVPELEGQIFIELETMTEAGDLDAAMDIVRSVLRDLGVSDHDLTAETYTDAVSAQRKTHGSSGVSMDGRWD